MSTSSLTSLQSGAEVEDTKSRPFNGNQPPIEVDVDNESQFPDIEGYAPLKADQKQIRLLEFIPTADSYLVCSMSTFSLLEPSINYSALSYQWGAPSPIKSLRTVFINGKPVLLRPSLYSFLEALSSAHGILRFWVDVLCINQRDDEERSLQVAIMKDIYACALQVFVWLGDSDADTDYAFTQIERSRDGVAIPNPRLLVDTVEALFYRPYWRRLWIIQEFTVASKVNLMCGQLSVSWNTLVDAVEKYGLAHTNDYGWNVYRRFRALRRVFPQKKKSLLDLIQEFGSAKCRDMRDKVYGLCGLSLDGHLVRIDYTKNIMYIILQVLSVYGSRRNQEDLCEVSEIELDGAFSKLRRYLQVSQQDVTECLGRMNTGDFVYRATYYGRVVRVEPLSSSESEWMPPSPRARHPKESVWIMIDTRLSTKHIRKRFLGNPDVQPLDIIVRLNDVPLALRKVSDRLQVVGAAWIDRFCGLDTDISLTANDLTTIHLLFQKHVQVCDSMVWNEPLDPKHEFQIHVSPLVMFLRLGTGTTRAAFELLEDASQHLRRTVRPELCACNTRGSFKTMVTPSNHGHWSDDGPVMQSIDLWDEQLNNDEQNKRFDEIHGDNRLYNAYVRTMELEWAERNSLIPYKDWLTHLSYSQGQLVVWGTIHNGVEERRVTRGRAFMRRNWSRSPEVMFVEVIILMSAKLLLDQFLCPLRHHYCKFELRIFETPFKLLFSAVGSARRTTNLHINLDALITNDNGYFQWVSAIMDDDELSYHWSTRTASSKRIALQMKHPHMPHATVVSHFWGHNSDKIAADTVQYVEVGNLRSSSRNLRLSGDGFFLEGQLRCDDGSYRDAKLNLGERLIVVGSEVRYIFIHSIQHGEKTSFAFMVSGGRE